LRCLAKEDVKFGLVFVAVESQLQEENVRFLPHFGVRVGAVPDGGLERGVLDDLVVAAVGEL